MGRMRRGGDIAGSHDATACSPSRACARDARARRVARVWTAARAAVSPEADPRTSSSFVFLATQRIIDAFQGAGFVPVAAAQPMSRGGPARGLRRM